MRHSDAKTLDPERVRELLQDGSLKNLQAKKPFKHSQLEENAAALDSPVDRAFFDGSELNQSSQRKVSNAADLAEQYSAKPLPFFETSMKSIPPGNPAKEIKPSLHVNEHIDSSVNAPKKKRGRPRKSVLPMESIKLDDANGQHLLRYRAADETNPSLPSNKDIESPLNAPKPGRPRKNVMSVESVKLDDTNGQHLLRNSAADEINPSLPSNEHVETPLNAPKRKPGRPRKSAMSVESVKLDDANGQHLRRNNAADEMKPSPPVNEHVESPLNAPKRKPGRPRKSVLPMESVKLDDANGQHLLRNRAADEIKPSLPSNEDIESPLNVPKRKPGRPRKSFPSMESVKLDDTNGQHVLQTSAAEEMKPSLPSNEHVETPLNAPKRKPGRPRKSAMSVESVKLDDTNGQHLLRYRAAGEINPSLSSNEHVESPLNAPKRKPGRPRKSVLPMESVKLDDANGQHLLPNSAADEIKTTSPVNEHVETPLNVPKRKPGRPRKSFPSMESVKLDDTNEPHLLRSGAAIEIEPSLPVNASLERKRGRPRRSASLGESVELDDGSGRHVRPTIRIRQLPNQHEASGAIHLAEKSSAPPAPFFEKSMESDFPTTGSPADRIKTSLSINEHIETSLNDSPKRKPGRPRKLVSSVQSVKPDAMSGQHLLRTSRVRRLPDHLKDHIITKTRTYQQRKPKEPSISHQASEEPELPTSSPKGTHQGLEQSMVKSFP